MPVCSISTLTAFKLQRCRKRHPPLRATDFFEDMWEVGKHQSISITMPWISCSEVKAVIRLPFPIALLPSNRVSFSGSPPKQKDIFTSQLLSKHSVPWKLYPSLKNPPCEECMSLPSLTTLSLMLALPSLQDSRETPLVGHIFQSFGNYLCLKSSERF